MSNPLATFKYAPTKSLPIRAGPIQCVRNCTNCILARPSSEDADAENIIAIKSFDNLVQRQSLWLAKYQTIQYHLGQVDILRRSLLKIEPSLVIYVIATSHCADLEHLGAVLSYEGLPRARLHGEPINWDHLEADSRRRHFMVPIRRLTCAMSEKNSDNAADRALLEVRGLRDFLSPLVEKSSKTSGGNDYGALGKVAIVPVAITKDHNRSFPPGLGSLCIQIMEPYFLQEYLRSLRTQFQVGHLVQHLYHDLAMYNPRLPCHLVAFLVLYLDRPCGVSRDDLVEYFEWLRKSSMEFDLHLAYTGSAQDAVDFGLLTLDEFLRFDTSEHVYLADNVEALTQVANLMVPNMAYYGLVSRAALMLHNRDEKNSLLVRYDARVRVKVMKDDVLELSQDMAERLDNLIPCRRPCVDVRTALLMTFNSMQTFGKYFYVKEARVRPSQGFGRFGDYDSDEDYYLSKRDDPAFKPWIILTKRPYRLDRLNLFMNSIEAYFSD